MSATETIGRRRCRLFKRPDGRLTEVWDWDESPYENGDKLPDGEVFKIFVATAGSNSLEQGANVRQQVDLCISAYGYEKPGVWNDRPSQ